MDTELRQAIFLTLKYFDLFDYPLRDKEIFKWLFCSEGKKYNWEEIREAINILTEEKRIVCIDGFYFLPGREEAVECRKKREEISLLKIKKARRIAKLLALIPTIKMIAVCSNLGYLNAEEGADIDFFIVSEKNKIWSTRFWSVILMKFLSQRPNKKTIKNKICLSYFVSEDNLDLEHTKIGEPDSYLIYLLSQYLPIYSQDGLWKRWVAANGWIKNYLSNFYYDQEAERFLIKAKFLWFKKIISLMQFDWEEVWYKKIQIKIMPQILKEMMRRDDKKVIINDRMLKLHSNDKREEINKKIIN